MYTPLKLSFNPEANHFTEIVMETLPNLAFIIEIILKFNTGNEYNYNSNLIGFNKISYLFLRINHHK